MNGVHKQQFGLEAKQVKLDLKRGPQCSLTLDFVINLKAFFCIFWIRCWLDFEVQLRILIQYLRCG